MADAQARKAAIKQASYQVRTGGAFVRRASTIRTVSAPKVRPATKKGN
jgi:hypothetical protein